MKKLILILAVLFGATAFAQVGIGTTSPEGVLDIRSGGDGAIVIPRVTSVAAVVNQDDALAAIPAGSMVYDETEGCIRAFDGTEWSGCFGEGGGQRPARTTNVNDITNADLNGFVIATVNVQFTLESLDPVDGNTITFVSANPANFGVEGAHPTSTVSPLAQGGGISYVYDAESDAWYSYSAF